MQQELARGEPGLRRAVLCFRCRSVISMKPAGITCAAEMASCIQPDNILVAK